MIIETQFGVITDVKAPRFISDGGIDCTITLNGEDLPFTARDDDPEEHGRRIYAALIAGECGDIAEEIE